MKVELVMGNRQMHGEFRDVATTIRFVGSMHMEEAVRHARDDTQLSRWHSEQATILMRGLDSLIAQVTAERAKDK